MYYTMDKVLWKIAHVQLAKFYGLPAAAECGGSMVHRFDQQSGARRIRHSLPNRLQAKDLLGIRRNLEVSTPRRLPSSNM